MGNTRIRLDQGSYWLLSCTLLYCWIPKTLLIHYKNQEQYQEHLSFEPKAQVVIIKVCHVSQQSFWLAKKWHRLVIWDHPKLLGSASSQHQAWHRYSANTQPICHRASRSRGEKTEHTSLYFGLRWSNSPGRASVQFLQQCVIRCTSPQHPSLSHKWQWLPNSRHVIALPATTRAALKNNINWSDRKNAWLWSGSGFY